MTNKGTALSQQYISNLIIYSLYYIMKTWKSEKQQDKIYDWQNRQKEIQYDGNDVYWVGVFAFIFEYTGEYLGVFIFISEYI